MFEPDPNEIRTITVNGDKFAKVEDIKNFFKTVNLNEKRTKPGEILTSDYIREFLSRL